MTQLRIKPILTASHDAHECSNSERKLEEFKGELGELQIYFNWQHF